LASTFGGVLLWFPAIKPLVGVYLMGLSLAAIPVLIPLDYFIGNKKA